MNLSKNKKITNKGITLIALVITIIVLLLLAGVSIATLTGENGILVQASNAKRESEIAEAKEQAKLDIMAWRAEQLGQGLDATVNNSKIQEILSGKDYVLAAGATSFESKTGYTILYSELYNPAAPTGEQAKVGKKVTGTNKEYTNNGTAVIPVGFTIVPGRDDVSQGLVISDNENDTELDEDETKHIANGNQFVWVPVSKENFATEFVREHFGIEEQKWWTGTFVTDELSENNLYEPVGDGVNVDITASESMQEVQKMYKSVKDNGGFYIGRYEAGNEGGTFDEDSWSWDSKGQLVVKKNIQVYNNICWADTAELDDETGGAVELARGFSNSKGYTSVTSTLVYGVQWDAVLRWISKDDLLKQYLIDSTPVGNYYTYAIESTGVGQMKNIYDMAGNVDEWTMESNGTDERVNRGGACLSKGDSTPVSYRHYGGILSNSSYGRGFRITLYL